MANEFFGDWEYDNLPEEIQSSKISPLKINSNIDEIETEATFNEKQFSKQLFANNNIVIEQKNIELQPRKHSTSIFFELDSWFTLDEN